MKIPGEEVRHVADLSELSFSEEEAAEFTTTLSRTVDTVEPLDGVDIESVPVTTAMVDHRTAIREDVAVAGDDRDELFKNML